MRESLKEFFGLGQESLEGRVVYGYRLGGADWRGLGCGSVSAVEALLGSP